MPRQVAAISRAIKTGSVYERHGRESFFDKKRFLSELTDIQEHVALFQFDKSEVDARFEIWDYENKQIVIVVDCTQDILKRYKRKLN